MDSIGAGDTWALVVAKTGGAIAAAAGTGKAVWNTIKAVGPYTVAQWDLASLAYSKHNARLAMVEAGKDFLKQELSNCADVSKELMSDYVAATPKKKLQIQNDLEFINQRTRQISIGILAIGYMPSNADDTEEVKNEVQQEISTHWMDKFNDLARANNEPWREQILARALAAESVNPGSVSPRALWYLGTLEEPIFKAFATILDLCILIGNHLAIPNSNKYNNRNVPDSLHDKVSTIGGLLYMLNETGFLAESSTGAIVFEEGKRIATYGAEHYLLACIPGETLEVRGILLSGLGQAIVSFCERSPRVLGFEIMKAWFESLDKRKHTTAPVVRIGSEWYDKSDAPIL